MTVQMKSALAFMTASETDWLVIPRIGSTVHTHLACPVPEQCSQQHGQSAVVHLRAHIVKRGTQ